MSDNLIYKVVFINQNQVYEVYAKRVFQGEMFGFVVIEDFIFGETTSVVVDPYEEKLKTEFANVRRSFIPMHEIIRIDQVERRGTAKIIPLDREAGQSGKVTKFYVPDKS